MEHVSRSAEVRPLVRAETPAAARVLARALAGDPGWAYVFPDDRTRPARLVQIFEMVVGRMYVGHGGSWEVPGAAAAVWAPPGKHTVPALTVLAALPRLAYLVGRRIPRALALQRAMARSTPREPHWYLAMLGVAPEQQGRGLGPRVVAPVLERCDATRTLAWLESTNPRNHSFYLRCGFEIAGERTPRAAPAITFFARRPR